MVAPLPTRDLKVTTTRTYVAVCGREVPFWPLLELFEDFENTDPEGKGRSLKVVAGIFPALEGKLLEEGVLRKKPTGGLYRGPHFLAFMTRMKATADQLMAEGNM